MHDVILPSNRGTDRIHFRIVSPIRTHYEPSIEVNCTIQGEHFDGDHEHDINLSLDGLCISLKSLKLLQQKLNAWLELPLEQLEAAKLDGTYSLSLFDGQQFDLAFGNRTDTIAGLNPVITVSFKAGLLWGEYHFVTDQSCLQQFSNELDRALKS